MAPVFFKRYWVKEKGLGKYSELYGITIDQRKTNPDQIVTYIEDNKHYIPAKMNFNTGVFDYGSWADAFFMKVRPCIVNYDGTVLCYLNPIDYARAINGNIAIIDGNCLGNVMIEFPKIYWKIVNNGDGTATIYVCDGKKDEDFHCWSHLDANGNEIPYCYLSAYLGYVLSGVLRSYSGVKAASAINMATAISAAKNNYPSENIWFVESFADMTMVNILLLLIGKSTDSQNVFGQGKTRGLKISTTENFPQNGILNSNGLFYCSVGNVSTAQEGSPVKVFGMENWWGGAARRIVGFLRKSSKEAFIKMTYSKADGSTVEGFNATGDGYIQSLDFPYESYGFVREMNFSKYGISGKKGGGNYNDGYTDYLSYNPSGSLALGLEHGYGQDISTSSTSVSYNVVSNSFPGMFSELYRATDATNTILSSSTYNRLECFCLTCKPLKK